MGSLSHDSQHTNPEHSAVPFSQLVPPEGDSPASSSDSSSSQRQRPIIFHPSTSSDLKVRTLGATIENCPQSGIIFAPHSPPDTLKPPVGEVHDTIGEHSELKGADAATLLRESSSVVAIAYELARRGWLTIDHAHQVYLGLNFGVGGTPATTG